MMQEITLYFETLKKTDVLWMALKLSFKKKEGISRFVEWIHMTL
jgi:hypothetical protein